MHHKSLDTEIKSPDQSETFSYTIRRCYLLTVAYSVCTVCLTPGVKFQGVINEPCIDFSLIWFLKYIFLYIIFRFLTCILILYPVYKKYLDLLSNFTNHISHHTCIGTENQYWLYAFGSLEPLHTHTCSTFVSVVYSIGVWDHILRIAYHSYSVRVSVMICASTCTGVPCPPQRDERATLQVW